MSFHRPIGAGDIDTEAAPAVQRRITRELAASQRSQHVDIARRLYRQRRLRIRFFASSLFAEPIWDMLLALFIADSEARDVSVSSACIAADVPATTALRYAQWLVDQGLAKRQPHPSDGRSTLLRISGAGRTAMTGYLDAIGP